MDIKKLKNDALNACTIWQFGQPALSEMNALFNLYKQMHELMVSNKMKKPAPVAFESWLLSTGEQLNSGYLWTPACPIMTSLIVNRLKSEATNDMKARANERASMVGLSYSGIASIIEEANLCGYRSALTVRDKLMTPAEKERLEAQRRRERELQGQRQRADKAEAKAREALQRLKEEKALKLSSDISKIDASAFKGYRPAVAPSSPCSSGNTISSRC